MSFEYYLVHSQPSINKCYLLIFFLLNICKIHFMFSFLVVTLGIFTVTLNLNSEVIQYFYCPFNNTNFIRDLCSNSLPHAHLIIHWPPIFYGDYYFQSFRYLQWSCWPQHLSTHTYTIRRGCTGFNYLWSTFELPCLHL